MYVSNRLNNLNKCPSKNPGVESAFSSSRPLLKNFWIPLVVINTPFGYLCSRMSSANKKVSRNSGVSRLSAGDVNVSR